LVVRQSPIGPAVYRPESLRQAQRRPLQCQLAIWWLGRLRWAAAGGGARSRRGEASKRQLAERNLEIISEAARRLPQSLKVSKPGIEFRAIAGIGNVLRHDYHRSLPTVLWETCKRDLEPLKAAVERISRPAKAQSETAGLSTGRSGIR